MRRLTVAAAIASLCTAGAAAPAVAKHRDLQGPAHVYWANLGPVAVGPYAMVPNTRGRALLVDGAPNDRLAIRVRGLQPGTTYGWHIHQAAAGVTDPCASPAAGAAGLAGWIYRPLTANPAGNASSAGRSFTFSADPAATYYVDVHAADGSVLVCGVLRAKVKRPKLFHGGKAPRQVPPPIVVSGDGQASAGGSAPGGTTAGGTTTADGTAAGDGATVGGTTPPAGAPGTQPAPPCLHGHDDQGENQDDQGDQNDLNDGNGRDWGKHGPKWPHRGGHGKD